MLALSQATTTNDAGAAPMDADSTRRLVECALGGQYQIVRLLGRGASGVVYLARERSLHRTVVLKVLRPDLAADSRARERFRREARTTAQLTHPGIVPVHAYGEVELADAASRPGPTRVAARGQTLLYMVTPYVSGGSLAERLEREPRLPAAEVRGLLVELAGALEYAHREGVVHRDVKPANVLLATVGAGEPTRPVLIDFGVAAFPTRDAGPVPVTAAAAGTPAFMAPEQVLGDFELDGRSDVYALGVIGYLALAGRLPAPLPCFRTALAALAPGAPADLVAAIERCLAVEPEQRWPSAAALQATLRAGVNARGSLIGTVRAWSERVVARAGAATTRAIARAQRLVGRGTAPRALGTLR